MCRTFLFNQRMQLKSYQMCLQSPAEITVFMNPIHLWLYLSAFCSSHTVEIGIVQPQRKICPTLNLYQVQTPSPSRGKWSVTCADLMWNEVHKCQKKKNLWNHRQMLWGLCFYCIISPFFSIFYVWVSVFLTSLCFILVSCITSSRFISKVILFIFFI